VVLPEPDGPSSARNSFSLGLQRDALQRRETAEALGDAADLQRVVGASVSSAGCKFTGMSPFESGLEDKGDEPERGQDEAAAKAPTKS
jgi:hypothetical protein